jgi:hypothetical protein
MRNNMSYKALKSGWRKVKLGGSQNLLWPEYKTVNPMDLVNQTEPVPNYSAPHWHHQDCFIQLVVVNISAPPSLSLEGGACSSFRLWHNLWFYHAPTNCFNWPWKLMIHTLRLESDISQICTWHSDRIYDSLQCSPCILVSYVINVFVSATKKPPWPIIDAKLQ